MSVTQQASGPDLPERVELVRAALPDADRVRFEQALDQALDTARSTRDLFTVNRRADQPLKVSAHWTWPAAVLLPSWVGCPVRCRLRSRPFEVPEALAGGAARELMRRTLAEPMQQRSGIIIGADR